MYRARTAFQRFSIRKLGKDQGGVRFGGRRNNEYIVVDHGKKEAMLLCWMGGLHVILRKLVPKKQSAGEKSYGAINCRSRTLMEGHFFSQMWRIQEPREISLLELSQQGTGYRIQSINGSIRRFRMGDRSIGDRNLVREERADIMQGIELEEYYRDLMCI